MIIQLAWDNGADQSFGLPTYQTAGAAGADLRANFADKSTLMLDAGERMLIPTGLRMAIPIGFEVQIRPRSGLALKYGISMVNAPGTIDSDYRGSVGVILINHSDTPFNVTHGMRIAQLVASPVIQAEFKVMNSLDYTDRGTAGFGSTGI